LGAKKGFLYKGHKGREKRKYAHFQGEGSPRRERRLWKGCQYIMLRGPPSQTGDRERGKLGEILVKTKLKERRKENLATGKENLTRGGG